MRECVFVTFREKYFVTEMALFRILSHISHIIENIYLKDVGNIRKDVHDLRGFILFMLAAQKAHKEEENKIRKNNHSCYRINGFEKKIKI